MLSGGLGIVLQYDKGTNKLNFMSGNFSISSKHLSRTLVDDFGCGVISSMLIESLVMFSRIRLYCIAKN